jgi:dTDP-4-amino-4,6-dideoxygalactose transaminase
MINIFQPSVSKASMLVLEEVFDSNWLGRGELVKAFEEELSDFFHVSGKNIHTIACATDAIFGVFRILNLQNTKKEVIVPSISFPAVASAIIEAGLTPIIVDVDPLNGNISLDSVKESLNNQTVAIFITHYGGIPVNIEKLRGIVGNDVFILEDAACAFGTFVKGKACGTLGDFGCWSFDAMKMLVAGEGGACYFSDAILSRKAKEYFYLGLPVSDKSGLDKASQSDRWWEYQLNSPGRRSMFTNINAAIALPQFSSLSDNFLRRESIRSKYCKVIDSHSKLNYSKQEQEDVVHSNYFFTILSDERDKLAKYLKDNNVYVTFRYFPLHKIDIFKEYSVSELDGARQFSESALNIPIHHNLTDIDVELICSLLSDW